MPEMYLNQVEFAYSVCGPFTKSKEIIQQKIQGVYKNRLDKACFQHDMAYGDQICKGNSVR